MLPVRPYTDEEVQRIVATDIDFRQKSGLRADRAHMDALVLAHDYTKSVPKFLIAATPEEEAELDLGNTLRAEVGALGKELAERQGSDFGGSYVDPADGSRGSLVGGQSAEQARDRATTEPPGAARITPRSA